MDINATGVFLGTKAAIPAMQRAGGGSIINISSICGIIGSHANAAYHASKGAVRIFSKAAAIQYAADKIRVNSVHPGFVDTPMTRPGHANPEVAKLRLAATPSAVSERQPISPRAASISHRTRRPGSRAANS